MSDVQESADQAGPVLFPPLQAGYEQLAADEEITFTPYTKVVLPLDGYVFWLKGPQSFCASGSLHYASARQQDEDATLGINSVIFTTGQEITQFRAIAPDTLYVGTWAGLRFAFSMRGRLFQNAGLYHYRGDAVYAPLTAQLIDRASDILDKPLIVSNSLPAWLAMQSYDPVWLAPANPHITLYPSFLVPENLEPPYGAVHIEPDATRAMQSLAYLDQTTSHYQLAADRVRVTLYGLTNAQAMDWLDLATQYICDHDGQIGLLNMPIVRDGKRAQTEISAIAMQKVVDFEVSYIQQRVNDIARQLYEQALWTFHAQPFVPTP